MIKKLNLFILILISVVLLYSIYELVLNGAIYPYSLIVFGSLLSIGMYLPLSLLRSNNTKLIGILSIISFLNLILMLLDYFNPSLLASTWNYSFALVVLVMFSSFYSIIDALSGTTIKVAKYFVLATALILESILLLELSGELIHSIAFYLLLITTMIMLSVTVLSFRKPLKD